MSISNMKRLLKQVAVAARLDAFVVRRSHAGIVLGLHQVGEHDGTTLAQRIATISPPALQSCLSYLQSLGYSFVALSEIADSPNRSRKAAITFDDGFRSVYTNAFPILRKFQAPFTVFLTTAILGASRLLWQHRLYAAVDRLEAGDVFRVLARCLVTAQPGTPLKLALGVVVRETSPERLLCVADELAGEAQLTPADEAQIAARLYLKPNEVIEMTRGGMTIGAHGHNHWCLATLDRSRTEAELAECKDEIKKAFGVQAPHYALPFGVSSPHVRPIVERLGFQSLCTTERGLVRMATNPYALPRLMDPADAIGLAGEIMLLYLRRPKANEECCSHVR
jgi:peptidoglycan/xylan/chitin deacetylase (PgdA/CDA1 family)